MLLKMLSIYHPYYRIHMIREKILSMFSAYWSLMADETEDLSNMEQVSICARFVSNCEVYEKFLGFIKIAKMDAQTIADTLLSTLISNACLF